MKRFLITMMVLWMIAVSALLGYLLTFARPPFQEEIKIYPTGCSRVPSAYAVIDGEIWYLVVSDGHQVKFPENKGKKGGTVADLLDDL